MHLIFMSNRGVWCYYMLTVYPLILGLSFLTLVLRRISELIHKFPGPVTFPRVQMALYCVSEIQIWRSCELDLNRYCFDLT